MPDVHSFWGIEMTTVPAVAAKVRIATAASAIAAAATLAPAAVAYASPAAPLPQALGTDALAPLDPNPCHKNDSQANGGDCITFPGIVTFTITPSLFVIDSDNN